ncbi:SRPBCC domain-containing protein [Streptomyces sp. NPDC056600]|uniref:SRPBCC domain-containing protein n=1 Tax=Streptomyces sp. NPDC056600 TaxID=3345874 RepID=UPI0036CEBFF3
MEHEVFVPVPADHLAAALADPERVARALHGFQRDAAAEGVAGRLKLRVAGSSVTYRGSLDVARRADDAFTAEAEGGEARGDGTVRATVRLALRPRSDGTVLHFAASGTATGRITGFEPDAVHGALVRLLERFAEDLPGQGGNDADGPAEGSATVTSDGHEEVIPGAGEPLVPEFAPGADGDFDARPDADDASPAEPPTGPAGETPAARDGDGAGASGEREGAAPADSAEGDGADGTPVEGDGDGAGTDTAAGEADAAAADQAGGEAPDSSEPQAAAKADADADGESGADADTDTGAAEAQEADADGGDADGAETEVDADADGGGGSGAPGRASVFDVPVPPPSLDPESDFDEDADGEDEDDAPDGDGLGGDAALFPEDPDGDAMADPAQARRTMIGRSAEEVDHAPPRGRYAPVPAPQSGVADRTLRWAAPAAAALAVAAGAIAVTRALRRHR